MKRYYKAEVCTIRDLSKRWYIYYWHLIPGTKEYKLFKEYAGVNRIKSKQKRLQRLKEIRDARNKLLDAGWSPFGNYSLNDFLYNNIDNKPSGIVNSLHSIIQQKKANLKESGSISSVSKIRVFIDYLKRLKLHEVPADRFSRSDILKFLEYVKNKRNLKNQSRNNYLVEIKSCFNLMIENENLSFNPCYGIKKLPESAEIHRPFELWQLEEIKTWMQNNDPYLLQFCYFIIYAFMRTTEICRLRVKDIDLKADKIHVRSKTRFITKPVLTTFKNKILTMELDKYDPDSYLFSAKQEPSSTGTSRDYFSKRFTAMKRELGYSRWYTLYGLRHTFICQLVENGAKDEDIMELTGHRSKVAFEIYKRSLFDKKDTAKDISDYFSTDF